MDTNPWNSKIREMAKKLNRGGAVLVMAQKLPHSLPKDLKEVIKLNPDMSNIWNTLTPLAQNEWICWVTIVKKKETRKEHLNRFSQDLRKGKRRPCCWPGCPHRRPIAQKWFDGKRKSEKK